MATPTFSRSHADSAGLPLILDDIPILYEDEDEGDMGESTLHTEANGILSVCLGAHLPRAEGYRVFVNMNLYYRNGPRHPRTLSLPYVSPDIMAVIPFMDLGENVLSYTIEIDGPAPLLVVEVLSKRSAQQRDLSQKLDIYAKLGIPEYLLVDPSGMYLSERLLLKRLQHDRTWKDEQDADGGITGRLGFRLIWDSDGRLRVTEAKTGKRYARPDEAQAAVDRVAALEAELARQQKVSKKEPPKRRKKS